MRIALTLLFILFSLDVFSANQVSEEKLKKLTLEAQRTNSDALVVMHNGELIGSWRFGKEKKKIEVMSITKSIAGLGIGRLIHDGHLKSVDQAVAEFYPEWNSGNKKRITIGHLLQHTSGLSAKRTSEDIYKSNDFVEFALQAEVASEPGKNFFYNNKAVNLLAGIVEKAAGMRLDKYLGDKIFKPMGIVDYSWTLDNAGNPHVMAGLQIYPEDLAKFGQLMLNKGRWNGVRILPESWIEDSISYRSSKRRYIGFLWWLTHDDTYSIDQNLIDKWSEAGVSDSFISSVKPLVGIHDWNSLKSKCENIWGTNWRNTVRENIWYKQLDFWHEKQGPLLSFNGNGWLGQSLIVYPDSELVVVRLISEASHQIEKDSFSNIKAYTDLIHRSLK